MKRTISIILILSVILFPMLSAYALTDEEKYTAALDELQGFVGAYSSRQDGTTIDKLDDLWKMFSGLGNYRLSMRILDYIDVLRYIEKKEYGRVSPIIIGLEKSSSFETFLSKLQEEAMEEGRMSLGSLKELSAYASARKAQDENDISQALRYYGECIDYLDSYARHKELSETQNEVNYQKAIQLMEQGNLEDYIEARDLLKELAKIDYLDSNGRLETVEYKFKQLSVFTATSAQAMVYLKWWHDAYYHHMDDCSGLIATNAGNTGSTVPQGQTGTNPTTGEPTYVYMTNAGIDYHLIEDCGGITGANKVTLEFAKQRALNPCVNCAGGTNPVDTGTSIGYYGFLSGEAYHSVSNCQGMQNAFIKTKEEWEKLGKSACSVCIKGGTSANVENKTPTQTMVYATGDGNYYHTKPDCTGMKNANYGYLTLAVNSYNKKPCPKCVSPDTIYVFSTQTDDYFHIKSNCAAVNGTVVYLKVSVAIADNKSSCPICVKGVFDTNAENPQSAPASRTVYIKTGSGASDYYHIGAHCLAQGVSGMQNVTLEYAKGHSYKPCPACKPPSHIAD